MSTEHNAVPEPTLRDVLDAVQALGGRMDGFESRMDRLEKLVVQGFANLSTSFGRLERAKFPESETERRLRTG